MDYLTLDNKEKKEVIEGTVELNHVPFEGFTKIIFRTGDEKVVDFLQGRPVMVTIPGFPKLSGVYVVKSFVYRVDYAVDFVRYFEPDKRHNPYETLTGLDE